MKNEPSLQPVLVVDDDADISRTLSLVLRRHGCVVTVARSGHECLRELRAGFRGLILMDVMMPGLNGWATIRAIQEEGLLPGNLICMLTACVEPTADGEGLEAHVFDYLVKPFETEELLHVVKLASSQLAP